MPARVVALEVLHRRIEIFLNGGLKTMDLVDEENSAALDVRQQPGKVARFFDHWAAGGLH